MRGQETIDTLIMLVVTMVFLLILTYIVIQFNNWFLHINIVNHMWDSSITLADCINSMNNVREGERFCFIFFGGDLNQSKHTFLVYNSTFSSGGVIGTRSFTLPPHIKSGWVRIRKHDGVVYVEQA
jgi:hypothetical protein